MHNAAALVYSGKAMMPVSIEHSAFVGPVASSNHKPENVVDC